jgi:threonine aldolase
LPEDHANARFLAEGLAQIPGIGIDPAKVRTNIVVFDVSATGMSSSELLRRLRERNVIGSVVNDALVRMLTHIDVNRSDCEQAVETVRQICG